MTELFSINSELFGIMRSIAELYDEIEENGGEITAEQEAELSELESKAQAIEVERGQKLDGYAWYDKKLKAKIELLKEEKQRLSKRLAAKINAIERERSWLARNVDMVLKGEKHKSDAFTIWIKKDFQVDPIDPELIPDQFFREKVVREVDKSGLRKAIKSGQNIPGVEITPTISLQIR